MRCFRLVQQSLESDHTLFGLTVTVINYVDVHAALSAATVVPVILLTALPGSVNFALSIIYINRKRLRIGKILLQRTRTNPKRLWSTISGLLGKSSSTSPSPSFPADDYQRMLSPNWTNYVRLQLLRHLRHLFL